MRVIQISSEDFGSISENVEKMLRYGGKAMQGIDELQQKHGMGGGMRDDDDDDDDDDQEREMEEFKRWKRMKKMRVGQREGYSGGQRRRRESGGGMRNMREVDDPYFEV